MEHELMFGGFVWCELAGDETALSYVPIAPEAEEMTAQCPLCGETDPEITEPTPEPQPVWAMPDSRVFDPTGSD